MLFISVTMENSIYDFSAHLTHLSDIGASAYSRIGLNYGMIANIDRSFNGRIWGDGDVITYINRPIFCIKHTTRFNLGAFTNKYQVFIDKVNTFIQFSRNRAFFDEHHEILFYLGLVVFYDIPEIVDDGYLGVNYPHRVF